MGKWSLIRGCSSIEGGPQILTFTYKRGGGSTVNANLIMIMHWAVWGGASMIT